MNVPSLPPLPSVDELKTLAARTWFQPAVTWGYRAVVLLIGALGAFYGWSIVETKADVATAMRAVAAVKVDVGTVRQEAHELNADAMEAIADVRNVQDTRAAVSDERARTEALFRTTVGADIDQVQRDIGTINTNVGKLTGAIEQMQSESVATRNRLRPFGGP